jgi:hypothetical protein
MHIFSGAFKAIFVLFNRKDAHGGAHPQRMRDRLHLFITVLFLHF